ncbi:hypothetical protein QFZ96_004993 [Paraburkholderia youngii]
MRVAGQVRLDARHHELGQIVEVAIEVRRGAAFEAANHVPKHPLVEADRIGYRHDDDFAAQPARRLEGGDALAQFPCDQHPRQLVGMQRRLDVDLLSARRAVVEARQVPLGAERRGNQRMGLCLHDGVNVAGRRAGAGVPAPLPVS